MVIVVSEKVVWGLWGVGELLMVVWVDIAVGALEEEEERGSTRTCTTRRMLRTRMVRAQREGAGRLRRADTFRVGSILGWVRVVCRRWGWGRRREDLDDLRL